ncbi:hypothetical protein FA95DRAFT_1560787 [Auriscalpium vulgare]|uniref:Uncharacterized protein n=1 Tax=Auriscalpium vulgare TaxID=40419 RepID=A0ACB8RQL8_9AGAM|nr:hypothetical protein FA95DRAFT_1560787 [Auriscalpium vulgare]
MIIDKKEPIKSDYSSDSGESFLPPPPPQYSAAPSAPSAPVAGPSTSGSDNPVNGLTVATGYENILGTWRLDPFAATSTSSILTSIVSATNGRRGSRRRRDGVFSATLSSPTASFSSQFGSINARLAVVGNPANPARADVKVSSRHSNITVDLFEKAAFKFIGLDVHTGRGDVLVLIPRSYSGIVELSSRHGHSNVLPYLSAGARIVKASRNEVTILVGNGSQSAGPSSQFADHVSMHSRHGNVTVGFSGEDQYSPPDGRLAMMKRMVSQKVVKT